MSPKFVKISPSRQLQRPRQQLQQQQLRQRCRNQIDCLIAEFLRSELRHTMEAANNIWETKFLQQKRPN
jgi:hypothetical protein